MTWPSGGVVRKSSIRKLPNDGDDDDDDDDDNDDDDDAAAGENILLRHTQTKAQVIVGQV